LGLAKIDRAGYIDLVPRDKKISIFHAIRYGEEKKDNPRPLTERGTVVRIREPGKP